MAGWLLLIVIVGAAIFALKGFDRVAGRGPKQVSDGIRKARTDKPPQQERVPCPYCAEAILPAARKCPHCQSDLPKPPSV